MAFGITAMAQQSIQLRSTNRAECVNSDMRSLKADFSFSSLEARTIETTRGEFSEIYFEGAFPCGNIGEPQLPMITKLIAIPTGATPIVSVGAHSETQYTLSDYGIGTVAAMQAPVRKNVDPNTVEYVFSEAAYARDSFNDDPIAMVEVLGTMRGITLGRIIVRPVRYNPVAGTVKVFNDIEVNVDFENGDEESTTQMFKNTFSPAFNSVYDQLFNIDMLLGRGGRDAYTDHPDLYNTPVKMLVICYSGFQGNEALNSWLQWKLQKGYYIDIYYTGSGANNAGTTSSAIASFIKTKYNASVAAGNAYTYLIVIGDTGQVPYYSVEYIDSTAGNVASDLGYASVDYSSNSNDVFPDMYYSRMSVENTTHLTNYINKVLTYEKFEFTDGGNYLNNVILVGGWDSNWTSLVARPTINYATTYYFNSSNTTYGGFEDGTINATVSTGSGSTCYTQGYSGTNNGCYNGINNGACFVNYTAHGNKQEWSQPLMTAAQVATLTNTGKYFLAVGNCCLSGNYNSTTTTYSPGSAIGTNACFGETMIRVPNAGAIAYIGCSDYTIWMEDYYWAVGSGIHFNSSYNLQGTATTSNTTTGVYDAMFTDEYWNSASSLLFVGNIAVTAAENNSTGYDVDEGYKYYFKYYHTFGDGSVMPYVTKPEANTVTIPSTVTPGTNSITVNAVAGSYVAVTDNSSTIYGVGVANSSGVATVSFTEAIPNSGTLHVVVTRQQYQPYFGTVDIVGGTQYNITCNQPQHGTISAAEQAYANSTVTLTATPETGYCLSAWDVRDANNNSITVTNNQFTMPESNVTVTATFVQGMPVTLASVTNGTISADPLYAIQGNTINLTATPASGYNFDSWVVYKTGDVNTTVTVTGNSFTMPNYPVTVSAFFSAPQGGEVTIGSGTGTTNGNFLPTNVWYRYSLTQQIYTQAELGDAGTITHISFYYNSSTASGDRSLDIYMSHTSSSTISSWVTESANHLVFSSTHNFTQGWNTIALSTPFEYNGTDNIMLTVDDNTNGYDVSGSTYFYTYSTGNNRAIRYYSDSNNLYATSSNSTSGTTLQYNNVIKLTKETPSAEASLSVSPSSLTGFEAVAGSVASNPQCVTVVGDGLESNLTVTAPDGFEISTTQSGSYASTLTLTPSSGSVRANVFVRLNSNTPGTYNGNLTFASGATNVTVSLNGTAIPGSGAQYDITINASPANGGTVTGAGTYYEGTTCTLTATPAEHYTFGGWQLGGSVVSNANPYSFPVTGSATYTAIFNVMPQYNVTVNQVEGGTITASPTTAYPGDVVNLSVTTNNGYFFVEWDVKDANNQTVSVTDNQFTMPNSNVIVTAVFSQGFAVTLEQTPNGTISADQTQQLQPGDVVTLTATPANGCVFLAWYVYKTGDPRAVISVVNDSWFFMPASDVTVQAIFVTEEEHEAQVGSGTSTYNYIPTYVRANYSLTQQIYLASELGNQQGRITKIAFRANNRTATRNLIIYIAHTEKSSFSSTTDWEIMGTVAKVFEGSVAFGTSDFTTITLDAPFEYDGTSNINICVVDNTGSTSGSSSSYTKFYRYSATDRALYVNGSSTYANTVGYSALSSTTGTRISYVNRINITMMVPGSAESLTVSPGEINDFAYEEGQGPSNTNKLGIVGVDLSNNITVNAPTDFEISLTEDGTYTSSVTIPRETGSKNRNVTTWDFEGTLDGWTALDADGDGYNWVLGSACGGVYLEEGSNLTEGHSGSDMVVSGSWTNVTSTALDPDNWLISPQVGLGGSFSMWAKGHQAAYPAEHFGIYVSTTGNTPSDFTLLNEYTATATWKNYSVDLGAYAGINGYIAVRHFGMAGNDQFILDVDDFTLDTDAAITIEMPVTITPATVYVRLKENLDAGDYNGTLTASAGTGDNLNGSVSLGGTVTRANYWTPVQVGPNTMSVIAQVQVDGVPVTPRSQWELGAFCGTECRGSVIGLDDEPVFFLTVYGNEDDQNTFMLYDRAGEAVSQGVCYYAAAYHDNDVIGTYENPVVLNFVTEQSFYKYIDAYSANPDIRDHYYLIATPIGEVEPEEVENMLENDFDLYSFDQTNGNGLMEWVNYEGSNDGFSLVPGKGYLYANSANVTLTFTGFPYGGSGEVTLTKDDNVRFAGWNLVGNPFAKTAYIGGRAFYRMNADGTEIEAATDAAIEPMEGIFVIAANNGETITFSTEQPNKGAMLVLSNRGVAIDRAIVRFDNGSELPKFQLNPNSTKVYIPLDHKDFAVVNAGENGEMPVNFKAAVNGTYTISVSTQEVDFRYLHLIDNLTGADVDLLALRQAQGPASYTFDANTTDMDYRFKLVFVCGAANDNNDFAFFSNGSWIVDNDGSAVLQVIDVQGRILSSEQVEGCVSKHIDAAPGVYMLRLVKGENVRVQKIVVR